MIPIRFKMDWIQNTTQTNEVQKKTFFLKQLARARQAQSSSYPVPKVIDFPRYNMKCSGENVIPTTWKISCSIMISSTFHVISQKF